LVTTSAEAIELAEITLPVTNQLSANVSMLPVMRQLTAFAIDLPWVGFGNRNEHMLSLRAEVTTANHEQPSDCKALVAGSIDSDRPQNFAPDQSSDSLRSAIFSM
jgi:hypothetical protein